MPNDSSTGGYLSPTSTNNELNDDALVDLLQGAVVGITGLSGSMVRPRWQPEAPDPPDPGTNWAAIGPGQFDRDWNSYRRKVSEETIVVIRNRTIEAIGSFYGPNALANCELLANGFEVPQNREALRTAGYSLVGGVSPPLLAPAIFKGKWYWKYDISFKVRQQQQYTYSILDVGSAQAALDIQPPGQAVIVENIAVTSPE